MKLGYMMLLVAVGAMLVIAPVAMGADAAPPDKADKAGKGGHGDKGGVYGKVVKVEGLVITITGKDKAEKNITTNADTKFVLLSKDADGKKVEKDGTLADVKPDTIVRVKLNGEVAAEIAVIPAGDHAKGGKGGKGDKAPETPK